MIKMPLQHALLKFYSEEVNEMQPNYNICILENID